jgi:hypothetical protein
VLLRFRFSNFRSFRTEQELSLIAGPFSDLQDVVRHPAGLKEGVLPGAAIYGANASGKTNVIQALWFMASAVSFSHRDWTPDGPIPRQPFIANEESRREPSEIEADFLLAGVRHRYGFRVDSQVVLEEWLCVYPKGKKQTWFHRKRGNPIGIRSCLYERVSYTNSDATPCSQAEKKFEKSTGRYSETIGGKVVSSHSTCPGW